MKFLNLTKIFEAIDSGIVTSIKAGTAKDFRYTGATLYENKQFCPGAYIMSNWDNPIAYIKLDTGATITVEDTTENPIICEEAYEGEAPGAIKAAYTKYNRPTMKNSEKMEINQNIIDVRIEIGGTTIYSSIGYGNLDYDEMEIYDEETLEDMEIDIKQVERAIKQLTRKFLNRTNKKHYNCDELLIQDDYTFYNYDNFEFKATLKAYLCFE